MSTKWQEYYEKEKVKVEEQIEKEKKEKEEKEARQKAIKKRVAEMKEELETKRRQLYCDYIEKQLLPKFAVLKFKDDDKSKKYRNDIGGDDHHQHLEMKEKFDDITLVANNAVYPSEVTKAIVRLCKEEYKLDEEFDIFVDDKMIGVRYIRSYEKRKDLVKDFIEKAGGDKWFEDNYDLQIKCEHDYYPADMMEEVAKEVLDEEVVVTKNKNGYTIMYLSDYQDKQDRSKISNHIKENVPTTLAGIYEVRVEVEITDEYELRKGDAKTLEIIDQWREGDELVLRIRCNPWKGAAEVLDLELYFATHFDAYPLGAPGKPACQEEMVGMSYLKLGKEKEGYLELGNVN